MCSDRGAGWLTEDEGKLTSCYSWNLKRKFPFPWRQSCIALGQVWTHRFTLEKKVWTEFFYYFIYLMHSKQWQPVFHMLFISLQLRCWHFWLNLWLTQTWTHFLKHGTRKQSLFFFPHTFLGLVIFYVITVTFFSMCSLAISPQAFNSTQKNRFDNVAFHTG